MIKTLNQLSLEQFSKDFKDLSIQEKLIITRLQYRLLISLPN